MQNHALSSTGSGTIQHLLFFSHPDYNCR